MLTELGHQVNTSDEDIDDSETLIALHAGHCHDTIRHYRETHSQRKVIVALSGSDVYPQPSELALGSIALADRVVALQHRASFQVPTNQRHKVRVIIQSAVAIGHPAPADDDIFPVCVVGHFRDVKDPLRTASATRLLPSDSKILVRHAGGILESKYQALVKQEVRENPRYQWFGERSEQEVADLIASSRLMVVSSLFEGGARVIGEALVHRTPVISSRIDGVVGLLGENYSGYFSSGDTRGLTELLSRAETDPEYFQILRRTTNDLAPLFHRNREKDAWRDLIEELDS